jgi:hypothetical protein
VAQADIRAHVVGSLRVVDVPAAVALEMPANSGVRAGAAENHVTGGPRAGTVVRMFARPALLSLPAGACLPGAVAAASLRPADGARS